MKLVDDSLDTVFGCFTEDAGTTDFRNVRICQPTRRLNPEDLNLQSVCPVPGIELRSVG